MKNCRFRSISRFISETIQNRTIVTLEDEYELVRAYDMSNGAISN